MGGTPGKKKSSDLCQGWKGRRTYINSIIGEGLRKRQGIYFDNRVYQVKKKQIKQKKVKDRYLVVLEGGELLFQGQRKDTGWGFGSL